MRWADVTDARDGDGVLLTVRTSKTNQEGDAADVRYLKNGAAKAIRTVRADRRDAAPTVPGDRLRWVAAGVLEAAKGFRLGKGGKDMPALVAVLRARDVRLGLGESAL